MIIAPLKAFAMALARLKVSGGNCLPQRFVLKPLRRPQGGFLGGRSAWTVGIPSLR